MSDKVDDDFDFSRLCAILGQDMALAVLEQSCYDASAALSNISRCEITKEDQLNSLHVAIGSVGLVGFRRLAELLVEIEGRIEGSICAASIDFDPDLMKTFDDTTNLIRDILKEYQVPLTEPKIVGNDL